MSASPITMFDNPISDRRYSRAITGISAVRFDQDGLVLELCADRQLPEPWLRRLEIVLILDNGRKKTTKIDGIGIFKDGGHVLWSTDLQSDGPNAGHDGAATGIELRTPSGACCGQPCRISSSPNRVKKDAVFCLKWRKSTERAEKFRKRSKI